MSIKVIWADPTDTTNQASEALRVELEKAGMKKKNFEYRSELDKVTL